MEIQPHDNPDNSSAPLVSILVRSMNRPELCEALQSVEQQTYPNIEIVLVDASGKGLDRHKDLALRTPLREISDGTPRNRPAAANEALRQARGEFMLFLDEDDWIAPEHISNLAHYLMHNADVVVAYSSTQLTTPAGKLQDTTLRIGFDPARLRRDNFIPIHSALFRQSAVAAGCHFDDSLDIFEDWDFWLQISRQGRFIHHDELTAFYRQGGESNTASRDPSTRYQQGNPIAVARARVFQKWLNNWSGDDINQMLGSVDQSSLIEKLHTDIHTVNSELRGASRQLHKANQLVNRKNAELHDAKKHIDHLGNEIQLLYASLSWRLTKPVRGLKRLLLAMGAGRIKQRLLQMRNPDLVSSDQKHIFFSLDMPRNGQTEFPEVLTISGWSCSVAGIDSIAASVNGEHRLNFDTGISRPDVAERHPECPDSPSAGFYYELALEDLEAGEHLLELRIKDKAGHELVVTQEFRLCKTGDVYNNWYWRSTPETGQAPDLSSDESATHPIFNVAVIANGNEEAMLATIESVSEQFCTTWKLVLVGAIPSSLLDRLSQSLSTTRLSQQRDQQSAIQGLLDSDGWTLFLEAGETLAPHALQEWASVIDEGVQLVYSDHDSRTISENHFAPCFTPEWAPDHLISSNYVGGVYALRNDQLGLSIPLDLRNQAWRYGLLLEAISAQLKVRRVAKVLWSSPESRSNSVAAETAAVEKWLQRTHPDATVTEENGLRHIQWPLNPALKVSIIIPTMGKLELLQPCMESLLEKTAYPNFEVVILDNSRGQFPEGIQYLNDKGLKVIECNEPFNWARLNNIGARHADGDLYLFLNDDIEVTDPNWLDELVRQASRPDIGAVGALLYYPNGALQHTGVLLVNYGGGGIHLLHKRTPSDAIYRKLHQTTREVSANTGACLMLSKSKFEALNGFDEELAVVGNDVDLCLRLLDKGYRNLWTPHCSLIHHESISRKTSVPKADEKAMWKRWRTHFMAGDRYYNPNQSSEKGDFSLEISSLYDAGAPPSPTAHSTPTQRLQPGVNLIGYIRAEMGIGEGARSDAKALDASHEPFGIINFQSGNPSRMSDLSWQHKEMETAPFDVTLLHINPDHAHQAISELPSSYFDGHYRIGYWAWELPEIPAEWNAAFVHFDEIWVPSVFVQEAVAMNSPIPVIRIPHAVEVSADPSIGRKDFGLPENTFLFLSMFDTHSRPERKNPLGAIRAFKQAFAADDVSVCLVLKVNNPTPEGIRSLKQELGSYANVILLDKVYSRSEINALIANTDCFVSLHRSEGFGFGPAEAMALGKAVMATNWSGNVDYMRPGNSIPIDYTLVTLEEDYGPYKKGQTWAEPDIDCAARAMRELVSEPGLAITLGQKAQTTIQEEFSPTAVGRMMRKRLAAVRRNRLA